jgi:hypothetical protein
MHPQAFWRPDAHYYFLFQDALLALKFYPISNNILNQRTGCTQCSNAQTGQILAAND